MEVRTDFICVGHNITDDVRCDIKGKKRITIIRSNFMSMKNMLTPSKLKWNRRKRLLRCFVLYISVVAS